MTLAILCPGQGAQHPAMLDLIAGNPAAEAVLHAGEQALGADVREWLAQPDRLHVNAVAQPLICLAELATWAALRDRVPLPRAFAGYSVGELASYGCAGALDAAELARLARTRAALMDAAGGARPGGLIALRGLPRANVEAMLAGGSAWIAIANGNDAFVVGAEAAKLDEIKREATMRGARITCLNVGVASHTPLLAMAVAPFRAALEHSTLRAPAVPVVAGVDASWVKTRAQAVAALAAQIAAPIEWARGLDALYERGCRVFLELGPGAALSAIARERLPSDVDARSVSDFRSLAGVASWLHRACRE